MYSIIIIIVIIIIIIIVIIIIIIIIIMTLFLRRVRASFSPEILQAGAVKGLKSNKLHILMSYAQQPQERALHFYQCEQYLPVSEQCYGCQCWGFLTCTQMLMHAIAHGVCPDAVRESSLVVDSGRKIPCCTRDSNPCQQWALLFSRTLYQLSYPRL